MPTTRSPSDLNECTAEQLVTLAGMTKTVARRIIAKRNLWGKFTNVEELLNIHGVGERLLSTISDHFFILPQSPNMLPSSRPLSRASLRRGRATPSPTHPNKHTPYRHRSRSPIRREKLPEWKAALKKPTSRKDRLMDSMLKAGTVRVDSAHNLSLDLDKLAAEGCNLTLRGGVSGSKRSHSDAKSSCPPLLTVNVKDPKESKPNTSSPLRRRSASIARSRSGSASPLRRRQTRKLSRPTTRNSSVTDEAVGEDVTSDYLVVRDTKREVSESVRECLEPDISTRSPSPVHFRREIITRRHLETTELEPPPSSSNRQRFDLPYLAQRSPSPGSLGQQIRDQYDSPGKMKHRSPSRDHRLYKSSDIEDWLEDTRRERKEGTAYDFSPKSVGRSPKRGAVRLPPEEAAFGRCETDERLPGKLGQNRKGDIADMDEPRAKRRSGRDDSIRKDDVRRGNRRSDCFDGERESSAEVANAGGRRDSGRHAPNDLHEEEDRIPPHHQHEPRHQRHHGRSSERDRDRFRRHKHRPRSPAAASLWCTIL